jgi:hypothetical protein
MPRMKFGGDKPAGRYGALFNNMGSYAESEASVEDAVEEVQELLEPVETASADVTAEPAQEASQDEILAALQSKLNTASVAPAVVEPDEEEEDDNDEPVQEEAPEEAPIEYGYDPGFVEEGEEVSYIAPEPHEEADEEELEETEVMSPSEEPSEVPEDEKFEEEDYDEYVVEAEEAEIEVESVPGGTSETSHEAVSATQTAAMDTSSVELVISLYEAIHPLNEDDMESLKVLLGNHTDSSIAEVISGIVNDTTQTKDLLETVVQLATVDTSDSTKAAVRYTMLLFKYEEDALRNLATVLGVETITDETATEDIVEALATTLASTPATVFSVAELINNLIP